MDRVGPQRHSGGGDIYINTHRKSDTWKFAMVTSLSVEDDVRVLFVRFNSRCLIGLYQVCG